MAIDSIMRPTAISLTLFIAATASCSQQPPLPDIASLQGMDVCFADYDVHGVEALPAQQYKQTWDDLLRLAAKFTDEANERARNSGAAPAIAGFGHNGRKISAAYLMPCDRISGASADLLAFLNAGPGRGALADGVQLSFSRIAGKTQIKGTTLVWPDSVIQ